MGELIVSGVAAAASSLGASAATAATIGTVVSYAATAAYIGYSVYAAVSQSSAKQEGPRLGDLSVTTSTRGAPLPRVWGMARLSGNVIDARRWETSGSEGGKGFGGGGVTTYSYYADFAVTLCEGPIAGVRRIWLNNKIWYDARADAPAINRQITAEHRQYLTVYKGTDTQGVDPTLAAMHAAGKVPPYRGTAYLVFSALPLQDFGNALPNVSVEVVVRGTETTLPIKRLLDKDGALISGGLYNSNAAYDPRSGRYFITGFSSGVVYVYDNNFDYVDEIVLPGFYGNLPLANVYITQLHSYIQVSYQIDPSAQLHPGAGTAAAVITIDAESLEILSYRTIDYGYGLYLSIVTETAIGLQDYVFNSVTVSVHGLSLSGPTFDVQSVMPELYTDADGILPEVYGLHETDFALIPSGTDMGVWYWKDTLGVPGDLVADWERIGSISDTLIFTSHGYDAPFPYYFNYDNAHWDSGYRAYGPVGIGINPGPFRDAVDIEFGRLVLAYYFGGEINLVIGTEYTAYYPDDYFAGTRTNYIAYSRRRHMLYWYVSGIEVGVPGASQWERGGVVVQIQCVDPQTGQPTFGPFIKASLESPVNGSSGFTYDEALDVLIFRANPETGVDNDFWLVSPDLTVVEGTADQFYYPTLSGRNTTNFGDANNFAGFPAYYLSVAGYDWVLSKDAYAIPLSAPLIPGDVYLWEVVRDLCLAAGLTEADIDVSQLTDVVHGYIKGQPMALNAALRPLMAAYFFDAVESDYTLKFVKRGGAAVATLVEDDLAAHELGQNPPDPLRITRTEETEMPQAISVRYIAGDLKYQQASAQKTRVISRALQTVNVDLPIVFNQDEAAQIAEIFLNNAWMERHQYELTLAGEYVALDPTDVITVQAHGDSHQLRITQTDYGAPGLLRIQAVREDAEVYHSVATGSDELEYGEETPILPASLIASVLYLLDLPLLRDEDNSAGYYWAAYGTASGWPGALLYRSLDGGASYSQIGSTTRAATAGMALTALGTGPSEIWDDANSVDVSLSSGSLESITEDAVLNGGNALAIGADGRWEIVQFATATLIGTNVYRLSRLLRGRKGTEWAIGTHLAGDRVVLLSAQTLSNQAQDLSAAGQSYLYKGITTGAAIGSTPGGAFTNHDVRLLPWSPTHVTASRTGGNDVTISWIRRSRLGRTFGPLPVGEAVESYDLEIVSDAGAVVRTFSALGSTTQTYTAAQQTSDGLTPGDPVRVRIYQLSAEVGRGYPAEVTV